MSSKSKKKTKQVEEEVEVPAEPELPPEEPVEETDKKKKKKKKKQTEEGVEEPVAQEEPVQEEPVVEEKKKKKKKKEVVEEPVEEPVAEEPVAEEPVPEEEAPADGEKKKKKKKKKVVEEEEVPVDAEVPMEEEPLVEEEVTEKKKKKKKKVVVDEEPIAEEPIAEEPADEEPAPEEKKKKKKKKKVVEEEEVPVEEAPVEEAPLEEEPMVDEEPVEKKKKKKKKKVVEDEEPVEEPVEEPADEDVPTDDAPKKKKKKKKPVEDVVAEELEGAEIDPDYYVEDIDVPAPEITKSKKNKKKTEQERSAEIDALLAEIDASAAQSAPAKKGKKGKNDKKTQEDIDALIAQIEGLDVAPAAPAAPAPAPAPAPTSADAEGDDAPPANAEEAKMSKAQLKRHRKKLQQEKAAAAAAAAAAAGTAGTAAPEGEAPAAAIKDDKKKDDKKKDDKKKAVPAHIRAIQEALAKQKAAEEKAQREAEERARREEEERLRLEEEERKKKEAAERKKAERQAAKEALRRQGITPAVEAKLAKDRAALQAMLQRGNVVVPTTVPPARALPTDVDKPKKFSYGSKKKDNKNKKQDATSAPAPATAALDTSAPAPATSPAPSTSAPAPPAEASWEDEVEETPAGPAVPEAKDSWEDDLEEPANKVKDSWDDSDEEETPGAPAAPAPAPAAAPAAKADQKAAARAPAAAKAPAAKSAAAKKSPNPESSSEEETDSSEESDSDDEPAPKKGAAAKKPAAKATAAKAKAGAKTAAATKAGAKAGAKGAKKPVEESDSEESETDDETESKEATPAAGKKKKPGRPQEMRSPICCILGHVDTGKTKLLDKIRHTNVQGGEAGGITQQIGATFVPLSAIQEQTASLQETLKKQLEYKLPGLLIIDTPGHESFSNLRSRGSSLCDIAVLVVDLMHGLEPQTIESLNMLKQRKTPFIVALNKVDRCYNWQSTPNAPFVESLERQGRDVKAEFESRANDAMLQLNQQGLNCALYYKNKDFRRVVSLVPTSAITGEGIPDLLMLIVQLTQHMMSDRLQYLSDLQCTVLEVKMTEGHGTTIDVILVNGVLRVGDTIVVCGLKGPIVTKVRSLLTPQPLKELRVRGEFVHHQEVKAAIGVKIAAHDLQDAVAGSSLFVCNDPSELEDMKEEVMSDLATIYSKVSRNDRGVFVQSSTLGSLEALLTFLSSQNIPVCGVAIGPVHKKDVMRCAAMLEHAPEYAVILAFDVPVEDEVEQYAERLGIKIFTAQIIYHLFDRFTEYLEAQRKKKREEAKDEAVFPCVLSILPNCVFNSKDPIIVGVQVVDGIVRMGTPICIPQKEFLDIGRITSIEDNHNPVEKAVKGDRVCVRIEMDNRHVSQPLYGRHFDLKNQLVSKISRKSIDLLKAHFKDDLQQSDWMLVIKLKKVFGI